MPRFRTKRGKGGRKVRYPITPRLNGYKIRKGVLGPKRGMRILRPAKRAKLEESLLRKTLSLVLRGAPILRELSAAYAVVDSVCDNLGAIKELHEAYEKNGWTGVADSKTTHIAVSSLQRCIIWQIIKEFIPEELHNASLRILSTVIDKVTNKEIEYVKRFLQENK